MDFGLAHKDEMTEAMKTMDCLLHAAPEEGFASNINFDVSSQAGANFLRPFCAAFNLLFAPQLYE